MIALIPTKEVAVMPSVETNVLLGRECSINAAYLALNSNDKKLVLSIQKNVELEKVEADGIEEYGVLVEILKIYKVSEKTYRIVVKGKNRVKLSNTIYDEENKCFMTNITNLRTVKDLQDNSINNAENILKSAAMLLSYGNESKNDVMSVNTIEDLIDTLVFRIPFETHVKQYYLTIKSLQKRVDTFYDDVKYETQRFIIENDINNKLKENIDESQRNYYLKEKMKVLKEELGENENSDLDNLQNRIEENADMPEGFKNKLRKELKKLKNTPVFSGEYNVTLNYIEVLLDLPFKKSENEEFNIKKVKSILDKDHYGLKEVKDTIIEFLSVMKLKSKLSEKDTKKYSTILCLIGPPGVGKTSFATSIAHAMNRKFEKISLGGVNDESEIRGHRRTYVGAMPGRIIEAIKRAGVSNPVILLDEIDKLDSNFKGDPASALLEVLDPTQNSKFEDHFIDYPYDLSDVLFICTANNYQTIPEALYDRMEIIELESYTELEKLKIAKKYLIPQVYEETNIKLSLSEELIFKIINEYTREAGVRNLKREFLKIARKIAREMLETKKEKFRITKANITKYLGPEKFKPEKQMQKKPKVGSVVGLAWTAVGGTTLEVQGVKMEGSGKLLLTGKLGDVMQESAKVAYSFVRSIKNKLGIKEEFEKNMDIHLHFPEGAVPKDGPSAGITITTAIISVLLNKGVRQDLAMTGEITINGDVLPVGGIKEKVIAAHRIGIREVILPYDNIVDTKLLPKEILEDMKFNFVKNYKEVLNLAFSNEGMEDK
ncbi:endopeptidase La [Sneathia sanguinegens]|uniref:endopeptidase La n=1 Tax=Sneathia sanguinegens TaxID=40543 RepID=UPI0023F9AD13|nr:endopeptidase La [Sneathia sanguinegens]